MTSIDASVPQPQAPLVRVLAADGTFAPTAAAEPYLALIDALPEAELETLYRDMVVIRAFDRQATNLQRQGQLALWPPSLGQEAAQVGSARAARPQDHFFPSYREHVVARIRGVDPVDIIRLMRGLTHGGWNPFDPKNGNVHLYTLVLGAQTLHATGLAMGLAFDGRSGTGDPERDEAVIVYYGDGATSQGDIHEAMVFAASYQTPEVFFLQNNGWAISVPVTTQSRSPLYLRGAGLRDAEHPGRRQRCARQLRRHQGGAGRGAQRRRPARDRGAHLPGRRAHDQRRPHEVPHLRRGGVLDPARPDPAHARLPRRPGSRRGVLRRRRGRSGGGRR